MAPRTLVLGPLALAAGLGMLAVAAARGDVDVHLLLVFPLVTGEGALALVGMLLVVAGVGATFFGLASRAAARALPPAPAGEAGADAPRSRSAGVVLIGPIPIAWGSDRRALVGALLLALVLMVVAFAFVVLIRTG